MTARSGASRYMGWRAALVAALLCLGATTNAMAAEYTLKFGHEANKDNLWNKAALKFKQLVETESDGRIDVEVYPDNSLGDEMSMITSIQLGVMDMTITGGSLQNWAPLAALLAVPYLFNSQAAMDRVVNGPIGAKINQQIENRTGLIPIAWFPRGPRELTSNRPIRRPSDLDHLVMRVPNVPLFVSTWQALGAKPVPMAFDEVFTALQDHTIGAQENPLALIQSASFYEVQKYVNETNHVRSWIYVVIGKKTMARLPPDLRRVVLHAAAQMQAYEHAAFARNQAQLKKKLESEGMTFVKVDQSAFAAKAKPAIEQALSGETKRLYNQIRSQQQQ